MDFDLEPGKYIVAVSGGVDSVVLLNVLSMYPNLELIVAHFDHGIRPESGEDSSFVRDLASSYDLPFEIEKAELGAGASEALARNHRYKFLHGVRARHGAKAILTAHHQDDVIETAWINIIRGTKYRGIYALRSRETVLRPFIRITKQQILDYAEQHKLEWREDVTNFQDTYLRNRIRKQKEEHLSPALREKIITTIKTIEKKGREIEQLSDEIFSSIGEEGMMQRQAFIFLPYNVSCEILATFFRKNNVMFDRSTIERTVVDIKTKSLGKTITLYDGGSLFIAKEQISLHVESSV